MRLINVETLCLEEFVSDAAPPYVILSHTWGNEEVSFQDFTTGNWRDHGAKQEGQEKIMRCCEAAAAEGFAYVWIDTCCIDKTSSAELSEAINSMFRWYYSSAICFAYLKDVDSSQPPDTKEGDFSKSRWFRRGWTLQELLAPIEVVFFGGDWEEIGTRKTLQSLIKRVTQIKGDVLESRSWSQCSVAQRMSWAASRETTRPEDEAYCLLGLFDVNMPLLYGEGRRAFFRLQTEIMKQTDDESIFAWSYPVDQQLRTLFTGMLATSPEQFRDSSLVTWDVDKTRGRRSRKADYGQEYINTFELVRQLVRATLPVFGPLVGLELGPMDYKTHLMSVLDLLPTKNSDTSHSPHDKGAEPPSFPTPELLHSVEHNSVHEVLATEKDSAIFREVSSSLPATNSDTRFSPQDKEAELPNFSAPKLFLHSAENDSILELMLNEEDSGIPRRDFSLQPASASDSSHSTQEKGAEPLDFSIPKLFLHSAENDGVVDLLPDEEDDEMLRKDFSSLSSSLVGTQVRNWQWYIYEPVLVAPLQCSMNGKQIGLLLSRSSFDAKEEGVLHRLHAPSLVYIDGMMMTKSHVLSSPRSIYIHGLVNNQNRLDNLPLASKRQEVRISSLLSSGYIGTQDKHTGWSFDSERKALIKTQSRDREEPHLILFRHISKDYVKFPSFFIEVDFSKPLLGILQGSSLPVKSHGVWRAMLEDQSIAEVPASRTNRYIVIKKRELAQVQYLNISVESKNWRPRMDRFFSDTHEIRSMLNKVKRFSIELDERADDSNFPYGFSSEKISLNK